MSGLQLRASIRKLTDEVNSQVKDRGYRGDSQMDLGLFLRFVQARDDAAAELKSRDRIRR